MSYTEALELGRQLQSAGAISRFVKPKWSPRKDLPLVAVDLSGDRIALLETRRKHGAKTKRPELAGLKRRDYLAMHARIRRIENKAMK